MKKFFLFAVAVLFSAVTFAQSLGETYIYKNADSKFSKQLKSGSMVYLTDSAAVYLLKDVGGARNTLNGMIDSSDVRYIAQWTAGSNPSFTAATVTTATMKTAVLLPGDTTTATIGAIVYIAADSSYYGCRSTVAVKKWYKLN